MQRAQLFRGYTDLGSEPKGAGAIPVNSDWRIRVESRSAMGTAPTLLLRASIMVGSSQIGGWQGTDEPIGLLKSLRYITGSDPDANTEVNEACPTNARQAVQTIRLLFTTDSNAATRIIKLQTTSSGGLVASKVPTATDITTISTAFNSYWVQGLGYEAGNTGATERHQGLPAGGIQLDDGDDWRTNTDAIQAGDDYSTVQYQVLEGLKE